MKLIVFDFDGTLVNSRTLILACHRLVFTEFGLPIPTPHDSLALIGRSLELVLAQLAGPDAPIADMVTAYGRALKLLRADRTFLEQPFAGIPELLHDLFSDHETILAIATGHTSEALIPVLDELGWRKFVSEPSDSRCGAVEAQPRNVAAGALGHAHAGRGCNFGRGYQF